MPHAVAVVLVEQDASWQHVAIAGDQRARVVEEIRILRTKKNPRYQMQKAM